MHYLRGELASEIAESTGNVNLLPAAILQYEDAQKRMNKLNVSQENMDSDWRENLKTILKYSTLKSFVLDSRDKDSVKDLIPGILRRWQSLFSQREERATPNSCKQYFQILKINLSYLYAKHEPTQEARQQAIENLGKNHPLSQLLEIRASFQKEHNQTLKSPKKSAKKTSPNLIAKGFATQDDPYKQTRKQIKTLLKDLPATPSEEDSEMHIDPRKEIKMLKLIREDQPLHQLHVLFQEELQKIES